MCSRTLGEEIDAWLKRWKATRSQSPRTVQFYECSAKFWDRMGSVPVSAVRRAPVEDLVAERAADHPRSAQNELTFLKRVLRDARSRGQRIDEAVHAIDPVKAPPRRGRALTVEQLYEFASWFPEHSQRLILLAGMVGARQRVWFELTDNLLDLKDGILEITPELAKNARAHRVSSRRSRSSSSVSSSSSVLTGRDSCSRRPRARSGRRTASAIACG